MRPDVENRSALEPPSVRERSAEERARHEAAAPARGLDLCSGGREIVVGGVEPVREHDERADAGAAHRVGDRLRARDIGPERLLEQERLAGTRGAYRQRRLRLGRHRDRDRVARVEHCVDVGERLHSELLGKLLRVGGGARPHAADRRLRPGREHRPCDHARPRSRADDPDIEGSGHQNELYAASVPRPSPCLASRCARYAS